MTDTADTVEREVTLNVEQELYVIHHADHISCYGFDNALDEIERMVIELVGRGALAESYLDNELTAVKASRGTLATYDTMLNLREMLRKACDEQGEQAVAGLTPQLIGLEGHRIEATTVYGETRRFIVGRSTGWMPCHLEIKRTDSSGGMGAEREYTSIIDLGKVR